jgi:hypothetical protein
MKDWRDVAINYILMNFSYCSIIESRLDFHRDREGIALFKVRRCHSGLVSNSGPEPLAKYA